MQAGAVFFSSLINRHHRPPQRRQPAQLFLDVLEPLMSLAVRYLVRGAIARLPSVLLVLFVDFRDLSPQAPNFSLEDF